MIINPIIPLWLMTIICILLLLAKRKGIVPYIRQIIVVILLFVINLRIMVPDETEASIQKTDANVIFVIDSTISMNARDYNGKTERLAAVKEDCSQIIDRLDGAGFAVITFNNSAKVISPFTDNTDFIKNRINTIFPLEQLYARGTSMNVCKDMLLDMTKRAKENSNSSVFVFFISDGEITNEEKLSSFEEISQYIDGGAVLGYGTKEGGKMYAIDTFSDEMTIVQDESDYPYTDAISKIDEKNLKSIAGDMGISYVNMNNPDNIDTVVSDVKNKSIITTDEESLDGYKDIYYLFVFPLLLLLSYEFIILKIKGY